MLRTDNQTSDERQEMEFKENEWLRTHLLYYETYLPQDLS